MQNEVKKCLDTYIRMFQRSFHVIKSITQFYIVYCLFYNFTISGVLSITIIVHSTRHNNKTKKTCFAANEVLRRRLKRNRLSN